MPTPKTDMSHWNIPNQDSIRILLGTVGQRHDIGCYGIPPRTSSSRMTQDWWRSRCTCSTQPDRSRCIDIRSHRNILPHHYRHFPVGYLRQTPPGTATGWRDPGFLYSIGATPPPTPPPTEHRHRCALTGNGKAYLNRTLAHAFHPSRATPFTRKQRLR